MVSIHYRKLYADLVTSEGLVCIAYVTELRVAGFLKCSAGYELYTPSGERRVVHAVAPAEVEVGRERFSIGFPTASGSFELCHLHGRGDASSTGHAPTAGLCWTVLQHRRDAEVRITRWGEEPELLGGSSYADEVVLRKAPRALGLRRIRWGRAHVGNSSWVFNRITLDSGRTWQMVWDGAGWSQELELIDEPFGLSVVRHGAGRFELLPGRALHEGAAIDRERFPGRISRYLARALSGSIVETRQLAPVADAHGRSGTLLHEDVRVG